MKKLISVTVILLFIGLAFAPSINANISKEGLVEFTTEVCGLNGGKQTVKLTQQQADEVEELFNSIREQLNATESREEAEEIFKDAVVELDKYGLLGGLSVKQAQKLIIRDNRNQRTIKPQNDNTLNKSDENILENYNCNVIGKLIKTLYHSILYFSYPDYIYYVIFNYFLDRIGYSDFLNFLELHPILYVLLLPLNLPILFLATILPYRFGIFRKISPLKFGLGITVGRKIQQTVVPGGSYILPDNGWIETEGFYGLQKWDSSLNGSAFGNCFRYDTSFLLDDITLSIGIDFFSGIIIKSPTRLRIYFIGNADKVALTNEW